MTYAYYIYQCTSLRWNTCWCVDDDSCIICLLNNVTVDSCNDYGFVSLRFPPFDTRHPIVPSQDKQTDKHTLCVYAVYVFWLLHLCGLIWHIWICDFSNLSTMIIVTNVWFPLWSPYYIIIISNTIISLMIASLIKIASPPPPPPPCLSKLRNCQVGCY